ncbi:hypothetical protein [Tahibacter amnicola]|uniref:Biopolymer transport protein ExbD/TolR n=1 Tax=Tahibacter amnicola TaxID=2976241 RepID=A0ABY6BEG4_9GAMM|nr:hypothetical protein [Tahibacter amnicola]UXI68421.1 hypothetical protein N4264_01840 [Tahibacter amnicola]
MPAVGVLAALVALFAASAIRTPRHVIAMPAHGGCGNIADVSHLPHDDILVTPEGVVRLNDRAVDAAALDEALKTIRRTGGFVDVFPHAAARYDDVAQLVGTLRAHGVSFALTSAPSGSPSYRIY